MNFALVRGRVRGGIKHTNQLKVLNYKTAIQSPNKGDWHKEIKKEKEQFNKYNSLTPVS
jgi:hypothetical protein